MIQSFFSLVLFFTQLATAQIDPEQLYDATFSQNAQFPMDRVYCLGSNAPGNCFQGGMRPNQIALTFDDGPNENTLAVLRVLRDYGIRATFYVHTGRNRLTARSKQIMDNIHALGHRVDNHGSAHSPLNGSTSDANVINMLLDTDSIVSSYMRNGDIPTYRNPGGYWSPSRANLLNSHQYLRRYVGPIQWNVGGYNSYGGGQMTNAADWRCQRSGISPSRCAEGYYNKIISNYNSGTGSLVLMHDIHTVTAPTLTILLERLRGTGVNWEFILVQDIPAVRHYFTEI